MKICKKLALSLSEGNKEMTQEKKKKKTRKTRQQGEESSKIQEKPQTEIGKVLVQDILNILPVCQKVLEWFVFCGYIPMMLPEHHLT